MTTSLAKKNGAEILSQLPPTARKKEYSEVQKWKLTLHLKSEMCRAQGQAALIPLTLLGPAVITLKLLSSYWHLSDEWGKNVSLHLPVS